jgi:hypothetical protein
MLDFATMNACASYFMFKPMLTADHSNFSRPKKLGLDINKN